MKIAVHELSCGGIYMLNMRLFLSAFIAFLIVFPIAMIKHAINSNPKKEKAESEQLTKIAIERGHVVTAKLIKIQTFSATNPDTINNFETLGIYEYFYNGKRYKYRYHDDDPEYTKTLYFVDSPRKATVARALKKESKVSWPVKYLIVLAVVYWIVGIST